MNKYINFLLKLNFNTIYFNFKYLPFRQAILIPVLISNKVYLRKLKGRIQFDCPIRPRLVEIGFDKVGIFDNKFSRSIWEVFGTVVFKGNALIGHGSKISVGNNGTLIFGNNFEVSAESTIIAYSKVHFGDNCLLSWDILIMDTDLHKIKNEYGEVINEPKPILIGDNVWIGCRSLILKGSIIPNNCVIGANSTVNNELNDANNLYVGSPVRSVKSNITWVI